MRAIAIIKIGDALELTTEVGDDPLSDRQRGLTSGQIQLTDSKDANVLKATVDDERMELANSLPLPYKGEDRTQVDVWFGFPPSPQKVFSGYLSSLQAKGMPTEVSIEATDKGRGLRKTEKSRNISVTSAAALVEKLASENDLKVDLTKAELDDVEFASVLQHGESNGDVIWRILEQTGHVGTIDDDTLVVRKMGSQTDDLERIRYGRDVRSGFTFQVDEVTRSTSPNVFDFADEKVYEQSDSTLDQNVQERLVRLEHSGMVIQSRDKPSYQDKATERALRAQSKSLKLFTGRLPLANAYPSIKPGEQIMLQGFGSRFSGVWWVESLTHDLVRSRTDLSIYNGGSEV